jgi:hypothetical protein
MVGTPSTPEKGHGQSIYVEHMEDSHSLCAPLQSFQPASTG